MGLESNPCDSKGVNPVTTIFEWDSTSGRRGEVAVANTPVKSQSDFACQGDKLSVAVVKRILRRIDAGETQGKFERYQWKIPTAS